MSATSKSSDQTIERFKEIVKFNGIPDPISTVLIKNTDLAGQNFGSQTQLVTVTFGNEGRKPLNLFVKVMTDNQAHWKMTRDGKLFLKEAIFYTKYLPAARVFCRSLGQEHLITELYPRCFFGSEELIVLENLVLDRGFFMYDRRVPNDFETAMVALRALAKHHAVSQALVKHVGGSEAFVKRFPALDFESFAAPWAVEMVGSMFEKAMARNLNVLQETELEGKEAALTFLKTIQGKAHASFLEPTKVTPEDGKFLVLNHGDYHNNNMMFRKDLDTGKNIDHVMIDLQVTRYGSLCLDLQCYLCFSLDPSVRRQRLHELLQAYLDTLKITSQNLGNPTEITFDELLLNYHRKRAFGFWYSVLYDNGLVFKVVNELKPDELPDMSSKISLIMDKWLKENPKERIGHAKEFINVFNEFCPDLPK